MADTEAAETVTNEPEADAPADGAQPETAPEAEATNETPESILQASEAEIGDAQAVVDKLEERVRNSDAKVTADMLNKAKNLLSFARLRREAAERRAEELRAQLEAERIVRLQESAAATLAKIPEIQAQKKALFDQAADLFEQAEAIGGDLVKELLKIAFEAGQNELVLNGEPVYGYFNFNQPEASLLRVGDTSIPIITFTRDWLRKEFRERFVIADDFAHRV